MPAVTIFGCASFRTATHQLDDPCSEIFHAGELDSWKRYEHFFDIYQGGVLWYSDGRLDEEGFEQLFDQYKVQDYKIVTCGQGGGFVWVPGLTGNNCRIYNLIRDHLGGTYENPVQLVVQYEFSSQKERP